MGKILNTSYVGELEIMVGFFFQWTEEEGGVFKHPFLTASGAI